MRNSMKPLALAVLLAAASTSPAWADDNGMTPHYGDSWAQLQAHDPSASAVPSMQQFATAPGAPTTTGDAWNGMRATAHRWREATSDTFHRMTGTADRDEDDVRARGTLRDDTTARTRDDEAARTMRSDDLRARDDAAIGGQVADPQAAPAAHEPGVAPGPAAADTAADLAGTPQPTTRDRAGPLGSGSKGTVDPTGVGAATMGGSPYGGNQDPDRQGGPSGVTGR